MKPRSKCRIFFLLGITIFFQFSCAQNIALKKTYVLSALPNYALSASSTDRSSLTDGIYTSTILGRFWTKPSTVGWQNINKVSVTIDLEKLQSISAVSFNTARGQTAGVSFPQNIYIFISNDNQNFIYAGDAADTTENQPGEFGTRKFILNNINQSGRYVMFTIISKGNYLFCDEIEIMKGKNDAILNFGSLIRKDNLNNVVDSLNKVGHKIKVLSSTLDKISASSTSQSPIDEKEALQINAQLKSKKTSAADLQNIGIKINQKHALALQNKYGSTSIIEKYNPWDTIAPLHDPRTNATTLNYQFSLAIDGVEYGAFVITNTDQLSQRFSFKISNTDITSIQFYKAEYIPSVNYTQVPDPILPISTDVLIPSGISQLFLFKLTGKKKGVSPLSISVSSSKQTFNITIKSEVLDLYSNQNIEELNAVNWAYLSYPMLKDTKEEAVLDLRNHHINTFVVPPTVISRPGDLNFIDLINYLNYIKNAKNILLFTDFSIIANKHCDKKIPFMSDVWKTDFLKWYQQLLGAISKAGITANIYLYPYDEVRGSNIDEFKNFANWIKTSKYKIKLFATLTSKEAIASLVPVLDIAQIYDDFSLYSNLPSHKCEVWVYKGASPARSLPPYSYYRLMAWKAFVNNIKGIGFWNYADEGKEKQLNLITDPLLGEGASYSVIYNGPGKGIIPSRRWEAFRLGMEDYKLLNLYSKKIGASKAKALAYEVLKFPDNTSLADSIRSEIIKAL